MADARQRPTREGDDMGTTPRQQRDGVSTWPSVADPARKQGTKSRPNAAPPVRRPPGWKPTAAGRHVYGSVSQSSNKSGSFTKLRSVTSADGGRRASLPTPADTSTLRGAISA